MYKTILESGNQIEYVPEIINSEYLGQNDKFLVIGMGGSQLATGLIKMWKPEANIISHQNYGLPKLKENDLRERLVILSSYSGNTEEVVDAYQKAKELGLKRAVLTTGGKLLELAKEDKVAYIQMPDNGIQPRSAIFLSLVGLLKLLNEEELLVEVKRAILGVSLQELEAEAKELAASLRGKVPVIYTSEENRILGYIWKINFNETGKIPAFYNVFPELNHNEMNGFDVAASTADLSKNFMILMMADSTDHPRIQKRMEVTAKLYKDRGLSCKIMTLLEENIYLKAFKNIVTAELTAYFVATDYGIEAEQVPMIEEFKKIL